MTKRSMMMIKLWLYAALFVVLVAQARSAEITVKVTDQDQQNFTALPGAVDQCVAGVTMRGDAAACKLIAQFATEFAAKVKAAVPPPAETGGFEKPTPNIGK